MVGTKENTSNFCPTKSLELIDRFPRVLPQSKGL